jgi:O-antigen/teichoic acid export membrane protein
LTQIYAGPFLSYGVGSLLLARRQSWLELRIALVSMFVFAALVLIASYIHVGVFGAIGASALVWFAGFAAATLVLAFLSYRAVRA